MQLFGAQTSLSQIEHLLQTAEAIRLDGKPEWMQVTGLVHDLGKLLFLFESEGQWDVVGVRVHSIGKATWHDTADTKLFLQQDTFVVGCGFSDKIIYPDTFEANPDSHDMIYSTENGIYQPHCGLDNVMLSWGHDEVSVEVVQFSKPPTDAVYVQYLYHVLKGQSSLPEEALAMIRYHSFYP
jgi:inositol oxygenase